MDRNWRFQQQRNLDSPRADRWRQDRRSFDTKTAYRFLKHLWQLALRRARVMIILILITNSSDLSVVRTELLCICVCDHARVGAFYADRARGWLAWHHDWHLVVLQLSFHFNNALLALNLLQVLLELWHQAIRHLNFVSQLFRFNFQHFFESQLDFPRIWLPLLEAFQ